MRVRVAALIVFLLLGHVIPASGASSGEGAVSLNDALAEALKGNPELRAMKRSIAAAEEEVFIARSFLLPKITFEERFMRTNNPTFVFMSKLNQERFAQEDFAIDSLNDPRPVSDFQTSLSFEQAVFAPKASAGVRLADDEAVAVDEDFARKREEVMLKVVRAFLGVQTARAFANAAEKGIAEAEENLRIADVRFETGVGLYSDKLRAEVALASVRERHVSAKKNLESAKRGLGLLLGKTESVDVLDERLALELRDLGYYEAASRSRADLRGLEARERKALNGLRFANAGYLPFIGLGGAYQMNHHRRLFGEEGESWQISAFLRWDIFDGGKRSHERKQALHRMAETAEHLDGLRKAASFQVYDAFLEVGEAREALQLARSSLAAAEEGRRIVKTRFENSLALMVDLLEVQASLDNARANVLARESGYLIAIAQLAYQGGTIMVDLGLDEAVALLDREREK